MSDIPQVTARARYGRAALLTTSVLFIVFACQLYFGFFGESGPDAPGLIIFTVLIYGSGLVLSIISIARGEPRKHALITLVLLLCGHLIYDFLLILPWFIYSLSL